MKPLHILVTAGPTREHFDPIRFISNRSSGKMGYAIARAAARRGKVTLVTGPVSLQPPTGVEVVPVVSAKDMARAVFRRYAGADIVIMCAAVCDYRPRHVADRKIKKTSAGPLTLELEPTTDILLELGRRKRRQILIGFAAETHDLRRHAADKVQRKNLDMIVANDTRAFEGDTNRVTFLHRDGRVEALPEWSKPKVAREILKRALAMTGRPDSV